MKEKIKVILADDHQLLLAGLKMTLDSWEEFEVLGTAANGNEVIKLCDSLLPDLILMDMQMPELSGADATKIIKEKHPEIKVAALTTFDDSETVLSAMEKGCDGFLLKVIDAEQLRNSLHAIMSGINTVDEAAMKQLRRRMETKNIVNFSERELLILKYICMGDTNKEIAEKLNLQSGTVKNIVSLLLSKTYCISRADLTRYAIENNLV